MALQFRRGNEADFVAGNLKAGEPAFTLDSMKTFVGTGSGASELLNTARYATGNGSNANKVDHAIQADSATTQTATDSSTKIATTAMVQAAITAAITAAKLAAHPVGDIVFNHTGTNPGTYIGGTWIQIAWGRTIIGQVSTDSDFATAGNTGGEKTHTLTASEMAHNHSVPMNFTDTYSNANGLKYTLGDTVPSSTHYTGGVANVTATAHNTLPPYIVEYIWRRTA